MKLGSEASVALPEDYLRKALRARSPGLRMRMARAGLAYAEDDLTPDTQFLLLRQLYLGHLELHQLGKALAVAQQMAAVGSLRDVARHDAARALHAMGHAAGAVEQQRLAARAAPPERRSFHLWCLAVFQSFAEDQDGALRTLARAERWATGDRPLVRAQAALIRLERGEATVGLGQVLRDLQKSPSSQGYGTYVHGMLAFRMGDLPAAAVHLRSFLNRHASADVATSLTLRHELRSARTVVARIESS